MPTAEPVAARDLLKGGREPGVFERERESEDQGCGRSRAPPHGP